MVEGRACNKQIDCFRAIRARTDLDCTKVEMLNTASHRALRSKIQDSFICFSAHKNEVNISNINILAQGGGGNDRTVF